MCTRIGINPIRINVMALLFSCFSSNLLKKGRWMPIYYTRFDSLYANNSMTFEYNFDEFASNTFHGIPKWIDEFTSAPSLLFLTPHITKFYWSISTWKINMFLFWNVDGTRNQWLNTYHVTIKSRPSSKWHRDTDFLYFTHWIRFDCEQQHIK